MDLHPGPREHMGMSRTKRSPLGAHYVHQKEEKDLRRGWLRRQRHQAARRLKTGDRDLANLDDRKTSGWLTW